MYEKMIRKRGRVSSTCNRAGPKFFRAAVLQAHYVGLNVVNYQGRNKKKYIRFKGACGFFVSVGPVLFGGCGFRPRSHTAGTLPPAGIAARPDLSSGGPMSTSTPGIRPKKCSRNDDACYQPRLAKPVLSTTRNPKRYLSVRTDRVDNLDVFLLFCKPERRANH